MMQFKIYHADAPTFMDNGRSTLTDFPRGFTHVATVEAANLSEVFEKTNHIDSDWSLNEGVQLARGVNHVRSTSVGDVVVTEVEHRFSCEMIGWKAF
jgi:hypothetical protein